MISISVVRRHHFTSVSNFAVRDQRLSADHLGLLTWLLSHSDSFRVDRDTILRRFAIGHNKLDRLTKHLKQLGYLRIDSQRSDKGRIVGWMWQVTDEPDDNHLTQNR